MRVFMTVAVRYSLIRSKKTFIHKYKTRIIGAVPDVQPLRIITSLLFRLCAVLTQWFKSQSFASHAVLLSNATSGSFADECECVGEEFALNLSCGE